MGRMYLTENVISVFVTFQQKYCLTCPISQQKRLRICSAMKLDIKPQSWIPVAWFFGMEKFFWFRRKMENGPFPGDGVM